MGSHQGEQDVVRQKGAEQEESDKQGQGEC